ncbi:unnamed protein product [Microthlaspi erraticum]|uniref:Arabidopsis retrotransposon Orf1 C-terminal domain-containing protein n=1 Tax=Microthlaspi erraticum TaxID=1685480 RepID=A0A6D2I2Y5_9BRAS|nr:unnamed protein product [Microthlaspi erraticum]
MEEAESEEERRMSSPCTKSTTMLSSPWTLWRPSTHMMTHEDLGSLRMWSWCSRTCNWPSSFSPHGVYKELTCSLEICLGSLWRRNQWNIKEEELQRVWATIAEEGYSSSRSKAARSGAQCLRYVHKALANTFFARKGHWTINEGEVKLLDMGIKPIISRTRMGKDQRR